MIKLYLQLNLFTIYFGVFVRAHHDLPYRTLLIVPLLKELLIIRVMRGRRTSICCFTNLDGMGSLAQVVGFAFLGVTSLQHVMKLKLSSCVL